uniref:dCMP deaminase n=1 Tax=Haplochromis burtoni TaxID=8153 RepID=A0A3Q2WIK6_HAPBU
CICVLIRAHIQIRSTPSLRKEPSMTDFLIDADYFMGVAVLSAKRSNDPNTQVGACLVNQDNKIVGTGHNCMPNGCEGKLPWNREGDELDTKYMYGCLDIPLEEVFVILCCALFMCEESNSVICSLKEVVYLCDKYHNTPGTIASKRMLDMAGIPYRQKHCIQEYKIRSDFKKGNHSDCIKKLYTL